MAQSSREVGSLHLWKWRMTVLNIYASSKVHKHRIINHDVVRLLLFKLHRATTILLKFAVWEKNDQLWLFTVDLRQLFYQLLSALYSGRQGKVGEKALRIWSSLAVWCLLSLCTPLSDKLSSSRDDFAGEVWFVWSWLAVIRWLRSRRWRMSVSVLLAGWPPNWRY